MLIFDHFETYVDATMFAVAVVSLEEERTVIVATRRLDEACGCMPLDEHDPHSGDVVRAVPVDYLFPFELVPPIVYVNRTDDDEATPEPELEQLVATYRGRFAGT